jgi:hypothetical protein
MEDFRMITGGWDFSASDRGLKHEKYGDIIMIASVSVTIVASGHLM